MTLKLLRCLSPAARPFAGSVLGAGRTKMLSASVLLAFLAWVPLAAVSVEAADPGRGPDPALVELFKILHKRGSISREEFELLNRLADAPSVVPVAPVVSPAPTAAAAPKSVEQAAAKPDPKPQSAPETVSGRIFQLKQLTDETASELVHKALAGKWYERLSLGGYTQLRYTALLDEDAEDLNVPADRSVSEDESLFIRRGRIKLSGDLSKHLFLYAQMDLAGSVGGSGDLGVQARDLYADIAFDSDQEYRLRAGLSKVPFGWVNMQSSQNRLTLERADAINSAAEGERDLGVFFMYAPAEARKRYKELVKSGLKGSGDYGVVTFGGYAGQGPNRSDLNGELHWVGRLAYPFKFDNGQFFELGLQGYWGRFVPGVQTVNPGSGPLTPAFDPDGVEDHRVGLTAVWYPQPFGFEAEWNVGRGPELSSDFTRISDAPLHGGYLMANYRAKTDWGEFFPFVRWQYYEGGRKFGRNAPASEINELDFGLEFSPWTEVEATLMYTHTFQRTDTRNFPYKTVEGADRLGFQLQWNY